MNHWNTKIYSNALSIKFPTLHYKTALLFPWIMAATLAFIPLGSTLKSIAIPVALVCILLNPAKIAQLPKITQTLWCKASFLLFAVILLACLWSNAPLINQWEIASKFLKILFLPVLVVGFSSRKTRILSLHAFLFAMLFTAILSFYYAYFSNVELTDDMAGSIFRNHIMTSFMMALACFISLKFGFESKTRLRYAYFALSFILSWQIFFINEGRTGYLAYLVMTVVFTLEKLSFKQIIYAAFFILIGMGLTYHYSPVLQSRVQEGITDIQTLRNGHYETSLGYRYLFHHYANEKFQNAYLIGYGTGSFTYLYEQDKPISSWDRKLLEPHSQYWLIAVEQGLLGLLALILFFLSLFWQSRTMTEMRLVFYLLLTPFILGNFTDSLLLYSGTGYLFIVLTALCLAETLPVIANKTSHSTP